MLIVRAVEDISQHGIRKGDELSFYIVDAHHHMGKEKSHRNTPTGAYEFYALLWFEMQRMAKSLMDDDALLFEPLRVEPVPFVQRVFNSRDLWTGMNVGWLVDRTIAFPYSDDYCRSGYPENPSFRVSNDRIAGWSTKAPHSARIIGFARVDPNDERDGIGLAVDELDRAVNILGLRGLKLHPLSQLFIDDLLGISVQEVVAAAGRFRIPVIFDTRNIRTVRKIVELSELLRRERGASSVPGIILAHCGMSPGDSALYEALSNPRVFGETSTLHGHDVPVLFNMAHDRLGAKGTGWAEKLLFGTDYSYLSVQAAEVILHLLSRNFCGTPADIQKILGGNALTLAQKPIRTDIGQTKKPVQIVRRSGTETALAAAEDAVLSLISSDEWDLSSVDFMLPPAGTWPEPRSMREGGANGVYLHSFITTLLRHEGDEEIQIWLNSHSGSHLSCSVLGTNGTVSLHRTELASQALGHELLQALAENSVEVPSDEAIGSAIRAAVAR